MEPNSDKNVVFDDDAIRHNISASYYGSTSDSTSESKLNKWLIKTFPFIKDDSTANFVMIILSVIIITVSVVIFFSGNEKHELSKEQQELIHKSSHLK